MPEDIDQLVADLTPVQEKWREIGAELGLQERDLDKLQSQISRPVDRLRAIISSWQSTLGLRATWTAVVDVLTRKVNVPHLATQLLIKHSASGAAGSKGTKVPLADGGKQGQTGNSTLTATAGLKRKTLHGEPEDVPLLKKKPKGISLPLYDPPSYDINDFVSNQPPEYQCVSCKRVPRKPHQLLCCNSLYCEPCRNAVKTCPVHNTNAEFKGDSVLRTKISKLTVHCDKCKGKSAVYQMKDHLLICKGKPSPSTTATPNHTATGSEPMDTSMTPAPKTSTIPVSQVGGNKLQREPLQQSAVKTEKVQGNGVQLASPPPKLPLPTLVEVKPSTLPTLSTLQNKPSKLPTLSDLQNTLSQVMALVSTHKGQLSGIQTVKLPQGQELQINVAPKQQKGASQPTSVQSTETSPAPVITGTMPGQVIGTTAKSVNAQGSPTLQTVAKPSTSLVFASTPSTPIMSVTKSPTTPTAPVTQTVIKPSSVKPVASPSVTPSLAATPTSSGSSGTNGVGGISSLKIGNAFTVTTTPSQAMTTASTTTSTPPPSQSNPKGESKVQKTASAQKKSSVVSFVLKLPELEKELKSMATKWRKLGRGLDQQDGMLTTLAKAFPNNSEKCLSALLTIFVNSSGQSATAQWKSILKALSKDLVGEKQLADRLTKKYGSNVKVVADIAKDQPQASKVAPKPKTVTGAATTPTTSSVGSSKPSTTSSVPAKTTAPIGITLIPPIPVVSTSAVPSTGTKVTLPQFSAGDLELVAKFKTLPALQNMPALKSLPLNDPNVLKMLVETVKKSVATKSAISASTIATSSKPVQGVSVSKPQMKATPPKATLVTLPTSKPATAVQSTSAAVSTTTTSAAKPVVSTQPSSVQTLKAPPTGENPARSVVVKSPKSVSVSVSKLKVKEAVSKSSSPEQSNGAAVKLPQNLGVIIPDSKLVTLAPDDFTMKPRREVHCSKCSNIPLSPRRPKCNCNVVYCATCAGAIPSCPLCGKSEGFEEDRMMRKRIWNLQVPCTYKTAGCDWKGLLSTRVEHLLVCTKRSFPCKYSTLGCEAMLNMSDMDTHSSAQRDRHLDLAMDKVMKLMQQVKALEDQVAKLQK